MRWEWRRSSVWLWGALLLLVLFADLDSGADAALWLLLLAATVRAVFRTARTAPSRALSALARINLAPLRIRERPPRIKLGRSAFDRQGVKLSPKQLAQHAIIAGASGSGKTNVLVLLVTGLVRHGANVLVLDLKGDPGETLPHACLEADRDCIPWFLLDPEGPLFDPLEEGEPVAWRDMLVRLEDWTEPHYIRAGQRLLQALFAASMALPGGRGLAAVQRRLEAPDTAACLVGELRRAGETHSADGLERALQAVNADRSLRSGIQGLGNRLALLTDSPTVGHRLRAPENGESAVSLAELVEPDAQGRIGYFGLDSVAFPDESAMIGRLVLGALGPVIKSQPQRAPLFVVVDEAAQLGGEELVRLVQLGRSNGIGMIFATQDLQDFEHLDQLDTLWASTATKLILRQEVPSSAEYVARSVGTSSTVERTRQIGPFLGFWSRPTGYWSERQVEEFRLHPNIIRELPTGRAVVVWRWPAFGYEVVDLDDGAAALLDTRGLSVRRWIGA